MLNRVFFLASATIGIVMRDIGRYLNSVLIRAKYRRMGVAMDTRVTLTTSGSAKISLQAGVVVRRGAILVSSDEKSLGITCALQVGARTALNEYVNIRAAGGKIDIGIDCLISQFVTIVAAGYLITDTSSWQWNTSRTGVKIGDRVWIGANSIILPGVVIGDDCVVGAGSVVTSDIPKAQIWAGNPARFIRKRDF